MLRTLSSPSADYAGHVQIDIRPVIESGTVARRVSRIATLDGSAVVNDGGYSDTDRTIDLRWQAVSTDHEQSIVRLLRLYPQLIFVSSDGVYYVAPETYTPGDAESSLRLLVLSKIST